MRAATEVLKTAVETAGGIQLYGLAEKATAVKAGDEASRADCLAAMARPAFVDPVALIPVYQRLSAGWFGVGGDATPWDEAAEEALKRPASLPAEFWTALDDLLSSTGPGMGAGEITTRTAALGGLLGDAMRKKAEFVAYTYPGVGALAHRPFPEKLTLTSLSGKPAGSLGQVLHDLLKRNGFDPEVLDREALNIRDLPPALRYLNARILSIHDVVHLVAGFELTAIGEVGISGFQLAQFGHGYSAMFLAVAGLAAAETPALPVFLEAAFAGWRHGRASPTLMTVPWENHWTRPIAEIRKALGIEPWAPAIPQDLFERLRGTAVAAE